MIKGRSKEVDMDWHCYRRCFACNIFQHIVLYTGKEKSCTQRYSLREE